VINNVTATTTSANKRYVRSTAVRLFIMFCEYMFSCYLFPFILLFSTSSMFELLVIVIDIIMFNIMELIMEIVPNYPTKTLRNSASPAGLNHTATYIRKHHLLPLSSVP
jgi:hypothetical protein